MTEEQKTYCPSCKAPTHFETYGIRTVIIAHKIKNNTLIEWDSSNSDNIDPDDDEGLKCFKCEKIISFDEICKFNFIDKYKIEDPLCPICEQNKLYLEKEQPFSTKISSIKRSDCGLQIDVDPSTKIIHDVYDNFTLYCRGCETKFTSENILAQRIINAQIKKAQEQK